jgi:integrase/recombinase XerD
MPSMPAPRESIPKEHLESGVNELHWLAFERSRRAARRSGHTLVAYHRDLSDLAAFHAGRDLMELTKKDLEDYFTGRLERLAASTMGIRFRSIRAFYNWAVAEEILTRSPMTGMKEPKADDVPPDVVSDADLAALLKTCAGTTFEDRRDTAIIRLFNEPGSPRVSEMAGIATADVDLRNDHVTVTGKGNKTRRVPFGAKTGQALDRYLRIRARRKKSDQPGLWLGAKGTVLTASGITKMLARRAREAGIAHIHPHQLRHTAAHDWMDHGGSEGDAMALFGWSSSEMPKRYGRAASTSRAHRAARRASRGDRL